MTARTERIQDRVAISKALDVLHKHTLTHTCAHTQSLNHTRSEAWIAIQPETA